MKRLFVLAAASVLITATTGVDRAYGQDLASRATKITFSKPIRLPGVTLPAGTYTFLHPSPMEDYHVLQVLDKDQKKNYGFFLTIPNERIDPAKETVVTFRETPVGYVDTVRAWFFPGEKVGDEFVYSRKEASEIANAIHQPVLTLPQPTRGESGKDSASKR
jgi:hypothetical protein